MLKVAMKYVSFFGMSAFLLAGQVSADEALSKASAQISKGQYSDAVKTLEPLVKAGNAAAQYHLGILYYNGKGVPEDERKAVQLLTGSAQQGNVDAMYQLGNAYTFGNEAPQLVVDPDVEAANWYFKAAKQGSADAQYSIGLLFMAGKGLAKNDKEAMYWMQQAAKNGHKDAKSYVGNRK